MRRDPTRSETLKRVHRDRLRRLRVLEYLDNSAVFADSPVEIKESYAVSDRDTGETFLVLIFRCLSEKPLEALDVRLLFLLLLGAIWGIARLIQWGFELGYFGEESEEIPGEIAMETNIAGMDESILC